MIVLKSFYRRTYSIHPASIHGNNSSSFMIFSYQIPINFQAMAFHYFNVDEIQNGVIAYFTTVNVHLAVVIHYLDIQIDTQDNQEMEFCIYTPKHSTILTAQ